MPKPRLLVTISFSFSIRYIVRTGLLNKLKEFCVPVIGITWNEEELIEELKRDGFEVHVIPENKREPLYNDVRKKIDFWFDHFCLKSDSRKIEKRYLNQFIPYKQKVLSNLRKWYTIAKLYLPFYKAKLFKQEQLLLDTATNFHELSSFIDTLNIDAVFTVTPFHRHEDILLRVCKLKGKKMITSILSFDNITKRGWIPIDYDLYMVWNENNKQQLHHIYPFTLNKPVYVTGAAQFDFYFRKEFLLAFEEWKSIMGLPTVNNRKIILYAGGPQALFPYEPFYLKEIDEAISNGLIKGNPLVLFRCHPIDRIKRWKDVTDKSNNIVFDISWTGKEKPGNTNITVNDIKKLCSTLAYTDIHINLCSTMTVDGTAFDKPQIGPAYVKNNKRQEKLLQGMYMQEHFMPVLNSGGLRLATSPGQMIRLINDALQNGKNNYTMKGQLLKNIISYPDGKNTDRVAEEIKNYIVGEFN